MYKRILTSLTVPFVLAGAVATGTATARHAWAVPSSTQTEVVPKPLVSEKLSGLGLPTQTEVVPKPLVSEKLSGLGLPTQTEVVPKPLVSEKLSGLGLPTTTTVVASSSDGFDWNDAGIGAAFVFGITLVGAASLVTIRRHHGPVAHN